MTEHQARSTQGCYPRQARMVPSRRTLLDGKERRRLAIAVASLVAVLVLSGPASATPAPAKPIAGTNGASVPKLDWRRCAAPEELEAPADYECSVARVPLSYRHPRGQTIELALGRLPARDQRRKLGSLFWNPGGPGGSGQFPPVFSKALHERFDLVGFDPRGVGASTPLRCFGSNEQAIRLFGLDFPVTRAQERVFLDRNVRGTRLCKRNGGPILSHMSTANVARDLDLLRAAVGDRKLTYLGYSYGTSIGEHYANLFPHKVRALTLDGVIDPTESASSSRSVPVTYRTGSFSGSVDALNSFLAACAGDRRCAFRERGADLRRKYDRLLARLRRTPVEVDFEGESFLVTYQFAVYATLGLLYHPSDSPLLGEALQATWEATTQPRRRRAAPPAGELGAGFRPVRGVDGRHDEPYFGLEWGPAVECTDSANPRNPWAWPPFARLADRRAAPFGSPWVYFSQACATWPARDRDRYAGPWNRKTKNPILLIANSQGDPATPYEDARSTERLLAKARLLTLDSFGHLAYGVGLSRCVDAAVDRYLIGLRLPQRGAACRPDRRPFDPIPEALARKREQREERLPQPPLPLEGAAPGLNEPGIRGSLRGVDRGGD